MSLCNHGYLTPFAWNVLLLCAGSTASLAAFHALKAVPFAAPTSPFIDFINFWDQSEVLLELSSTRKF